MFTLTPSPHRPTVELHITTTGELSAFPVASFSSSSSSFSVLCQTISLQHSFTSLQTFNNSSLQQNFAFCNISSHLQLVSRFARSARAGLPDSKVPPLSLPTHPQQVSKPPRATGRKESKKETQVAPIQPTRAAQYCEDS